MVNRSEVWRFGALLAVSAMAGSVLAGSVEDQVEEIADRVVSSGLVPGVVIGRRTASGEDAFVVERGVSDMAEGTPMSAANAQRIGSVTKSFTITRLLQLVDEGRVSLDDPIDKFVKNVRNGDATLRELANMTSGIFNYTEDTSFVLRFAFHPTERWTDRQLVDVANGHAPYFKPGGGWHYSNTNTILLGMVVEDVTRNRLGPEIERNVIRPLRLSHTSYPVGIFLPAPFSHGYATLDTDVGRMDVTELTPSALSGAGAIVSRLDDLFVWGRALARGTLVSGDAQRERLRMVNSAAGEGPFYNRYGLGMGRINGWLGHTADVLGFQTLVMHNLLSDETVVILVNASNPTHVPTEIFQTMTRFLPRAIPSARPRVRIAGGRTRIVNEGTTTLRGTARSDAGILLVTDGGGRVARGRESWRLPVRLRVGRNVIRVRAVDRWGQVSTVERAVVERP